MAYCLNHLGYHEEATNFCEAAINHDHSRANVYKNFGISLVGLNKVVAAAKIWIKALHVDVSDNRSLALLEKIMASHGEQIREEIHDIDEQIESCKSAVASAKTGRFADWARGLTLN